MYSTYDKTTKTKLQDYKRNNGKKIQWRMKKKYARRLAESYKRLALKIMSLRERFEKRAEKLCMCAGTLTYSPVIGGGKKLVNAYFCQLPLCPICMWRRSEKIHGQVYKVMNHLEESGKDFKYVFLTLTIKNMPGEKLNDALNEMQEAWNRMVRRAAFKKMSRGFIRMLEVTYNYKDKEFHPHLHVIIAVDPKYLDEKEDYVLHREWLQMWRDSMRLDYDPWVRIQMVVKGRSKTKNEISFNGAVAELSKYTTKPDSIMPPWYDKKALAKFEKSDTGIKIESKKHAEKLTDEIIRWLDPALHKRQRIGWGGELYKARKELKLEDIENSSLIDTDGQDKTGQVDKSIKILFGFNPLYDDYVLYRIYKIMEDGEEVDLPLACYYEITMNSSATGFT